MAEQTKLNLPRDLLVMDMVGAVLIGMGLSDGLGRTTLVPESLQFMHYAAAMTAIGIALALPLVVWMIRRIVKPQTTGDRTRLKVNNTDSLNISDICVLMPVMVNALFSRSIVAT